MNRLWVKEGYYQWREFSIVVVLSLSLGYLNLSAPTHSCIILHPCLLIRLSLAKTLHHIWKSSSRSPQHKMKLVRWVLSTGVPASFANTDFWWNWPRSRSRLSWRMVSAETSAECEARLTSEQQNERARSSSWWRRRAQQPTTLWHKQLSRHVARSWWVCYYCKSDPLWTSQHVHVD